VRVLSLQAAGRQADSPAVFAVGVETDDQTRQALWVDGRLLDDPARFAAHVQERTGLACTNPFDGDAGGWHARLGELLVAGGGGAARQSNLQPAGLPAAPAPAGQREALLSATGLGQAVLDAERVATMTADEAPAPAPAAVETFAEKCGREAEAAARAARATRARLLRMTPVGRHVLALDRSDG
jgi:hypothetical protein